MNGKETRLKSLEIRTNVFLLGLLFSFSIRCRSRRNE